MRRLQQNTNGFTIVELMIATMVFSVILLVITAGLIGIGRFYYKGYTSSQVQETSRAIIDDIANSIKFSSRGQMITDVAQDPGNNSYYFCIGTKRYSFIKDFTLKDTTPQPGHQETNHGLVVDTSTSCNSALNMFSTSALPGTTTEMLGRNMRLADIRIQAVDSTQQTYLVRVRLLYADYDLVNGSGFSEQCNAGAGSQYCAVSELSTVVQKRVN